MKMNFKINPLFRLLITTMLLLIVVTSAYGLDPKKAITQYQHRIWNTEQGLPQNTACCIQQTDDGYLWIGTSEGLARFDGVQFKVFDSNNTPALIDHAVLTMIKDRQGSLWIGTHEGLMQFKDNHFTAFTKEQGLPTGGVENLYQDRSGAIWFKIREIGLIRFADGKFTTFPLNDAAGLHFYGESICEDAAGNLLVGTSKGLRQLKDQQLINYSVSLPEREVLAVYRDKINQLWVSYKDLGLYQLKDGTAKLYTTKEGLVNNEVLAIYEDRDDNLWIGTYGGINRWSNGRMTGFTTTEGLSDNSITAFYEDREGNLWIGTNSGGINQFKDGKFTLYTLKEGLPTRIPKLVEDQTGTIWAINREGQTVKLVDGLFAVASLNFAQIQPRPLATTIAPSLDPQSLSLTDRADRVWQGKYSVGVTMRQNGVETTYSMNNSLSSNTISLIYEDSRSNIWIGTFTAGLNMLQDGKFTNFTKRDGLKSDMIRYLHEDHQGNIWIGTFGGGLSRLKNGKITTYTRKEGLFDDVVFQILEDERQNLWMSSNKGIFRVNIADLDAYDRGEIKSIRSIAYGREDGLKNPECTGGVDYALKSRDGRLWFCTIDGVAVIDPNNIKLNQLPPPIVIEEVRIDGLPHSLKQYLQLPASIEKLEFQYTALSFTAPEKIKFQYILDGYEKNWNDVGARRIAYYGNLPPGKYIFKVRAGNHDGVWNELGSPFQFEVLIPLWQTWWAYCLYGLAIFGLSYGGAQLRLRRLRRQNEQLETRILQRTEVIEEQKQDLARQKEALARKNQELERKNIELLISNQRADRIFSALAEALPGTVLDEKYQLDEKIGAGGFGAVFRATHLALKHPIAIKIFKPIPGNDSAENLERFRLEAIAASRINHPNAVAVLDSGISSEGIAYIVMELLDGHSLATELQKRGILSIQRVVEILLPICDVLTKAHDLGLVHRDIKPENIFLHHIDQREVIKVVDFGIAKFADEHADVEIKNLTPANNIIGTPGYIAPERILFHLYDGRTDIYSLGVMIYEMLCGRLPFQHTEWANMLMQHVKQTPADVHTYNPTVPDNLAALIMRMLAKQPENRPTAKELALELRKLAILPADHIIGDHNYQSRITYDEQERDTLKLQATLQEIESENTE